MDAKGKARFRVLHFNLGPRAHRLGIVLGSGARHFPFAEMRTITRQTSRAKAKEAVAARLCAWFVRMNKEVSAKEPATVGPEAVCAWTFAQGGSAHAAYDANGRRSSDTGILPTVARGFPPTQLLQPMWEQVKMGMVGWNPGDPLPGPSKWN